MADQKPDAQPHENAAREDRSYTPDTVEANHNARQGGGMGARDLQAQADAPGAYRDVGDDGGDQYDMDGGDEVQEDGGAPAGGMQQGATHAARPDRTEDERGQGPKTLAAQRDQVERR
jgi:hypothetical protein